MPLRTARKLYLLLSPRKSRHQLEERERLLEERISQVYRFVDFGRLASGVFHDLMNPLSVVALSIEKLRKTTGVDISPETLEYLDRAIRASRRMESFMQTAKKQLDHKDHDLVFSAGSEIEDAISLLAHKAKKFNVAVRFTAQEDVLLHGNPVKYFRIAKNLVSNAIDSYSTTPANRTRQIDVSLSSHENLCVLSVKDKGCGIPDSMRSLVFEPFFTTKLHASREDAGLGLGLMFTKDFVEQDFKGHVELESAVGEGSTFTVYIPLAEKAADAPRANTPTESRQTKPSGVGR